jgi:hypothetical protein
MIEDLKVLANRRDVPYPVSAHGISGRAADLAMDRRHSRGCIFPHCGEVKCHNAAEIKKAAGVY